MFEIDPNKTTQFTRYVPACDNTRAAEKITLNIHDPPIEHQPASWMDEISESLKTFLQLYTVWSVCGIKTLH